MTKLNKAIKRESSDSIFEQRKARPVIITLNPPNLVGLRLKGTLRTYYLPAEKLYRLAVQASIEHERKQRRARKARKEA